MSHKTATITTPVATSPPLSSRVGHIMKDKQQKKEKVLKVTPRKNLRSNTCPKCGYTNSRPYVVKQHISKCQYCSTCNTKFFTEAAVLKHTCKLIECGKCRQVFKNRARYDQHTSSCNATHRCEYCGRRFHNKLSFDSHKCKNKCITCEKSFKDSTLLKSHKCEVKCERCERTFRNNWDKRQHACRSPKVICRKCGLELANRHAHNLHYREHHLQRGKGNEAFINQSISNGKDPELDKFYLRYKSFVFDNHFIHPVVSVYNFWLKEDFTIDDLMQHVEEIFHQRVESFKINLAFSMILRNIDTQELRFFKAFSNFPVFHRPLHISSSKHLSRLRKRFENLDLEAYGKKSRPDTRWRCIFLCNVRYFVYSSGFPLGSSVSVNASFIQNSSNIVSLISPYKNLTPYRDKRCIFRCLTFHVHGLELYKSSSQFEKQVEEYIKSYSSTVKKFDEDKGMLFKDLPLFEQFCKRNVFVYQLNSQQVGVIVHKSLGRFDDDMHLNLYEDHLSYIKNIDVYCKKFECGSCQTLFKRRSDLARHASSCKKATRLVFPGGYYTPNKTIFSELRELGIDVDFSEQVYDYICVFDMEAMLMKPSENDFAGDKTTTTSVHSPVSTAICANLDPFREPHCIINPNPDELVAEMVSYLFKIQEKAETLTRKKFARVFSALDELMCDWSDESTSCPETDGGFRRRMRDRIERLRSQMDLFCSQLIVLTFNGAVYDLNLINAKLFKGIGLHTDENAFVVKKVKAYLAVCTTHFRLLDVTNFIANGSSYEKFLDAFSVSQKKGYFCFEFLTDPQKLDYPRLPDYDCFYSTLKQKNTIGSLEKYEELKSVWEENNMKSVRDLLSWYNCLDCGPLLEGCLRLRDYFRIHQIDLFKECISLAGSAKLLASRMCANDGNYFSLFHHEDAQLYFDIRAACVGGPSITFTRLVERGVSKIPDSDNVVTDICGVDCTSLYPFAMGAKMPTGRYCVRLESNNYRPEFRDRFEQAFLYMDFISQERGIRILHSRSNGGREVSYGRFPVDGVCLEEKTIFDFRGCRTHLHHISECPINAKSNNPKLMEGFEAQDRREKARVAYYEALGFRTEIMYECVFSALCQSDPKLKQFVEDSRKGFYKPHKRSLSMEEVLQAIMDGSIYCAAQVDISVPVRWGKHFSHPTLSPYEYYKTMCPLFVTCETPFSEIGKVMQDYALANNLGKHSRVQLISGLRAEKVFLSSDLLQFYLKHGLEVTRVHQLVEWQGSYSFSKFSEWVMAQRRASDEDPTKEMLGNMSKQIANSLYGSYLVCKHRHTRVAYTDGEREACLAVNSRYFKALTVLGDDELYEVESLKKRIVIDTPITVAFMILSAAKKAILSFFYDFLDVYVSRTRYNLLYIDTDSFYLSLSAYDGVDEVDKQMYRSMESLDRVIKPEYRQKYFDTIYNRCDDDPYQPDFKDIWFCRRCCSRHFLFDSRTYGIYKYEFRNGDAMVSLGSKSYIAKSDRDQHTKISAKGVRSREITDAFDKFYDTVQNKTSHEAVNRGFQLKKGRIITYAQSRTGLSWYYTKRKVLEGSFHTLPHTFLMKPHKATTSQDFTIQE